MAKKSSVKYICSVCGAAFLSWSGKCSSCGNWNTLVEQLNVSASAAKAAGRGNVLKPQTATEVIKDAKTLIRLQTGFADIDSVLGGGFIPGSVNLLAGAPGIGKSTLLLQVAAAIALASPVLYVSGEESVEQVAMRCSRLGVANNNLRIASTTSADDIAATIAGAEFGLVVVDSIQTVACEDISSAAGSVSQITNSTQLLTAAAKQHRTALLLVGHVTKEGSIAGPKVLEHAVDVVLQLEGDRYGGFKVLRAIKNRFGTTSEAGIFEMKETGLASVQNPSAALLAERHITDGSIVTATIEGTRPLLVEVQALVNKTSYGYPKRTAVGFDINRLNLLIAMIERRTKLRLNESDIYINIVGGIKLNDPAADLAVVMAVASAAKGMQLKKNAVVFGELGLSGEVRHVSNIDKRIAEAKKLGFDLAIGPTTPQKKPPFYQPIADVRSALNTYLD